MEEYDLVVSIDAPFCLENLIFKIIDHLPKKSNHFKEPIHLVLHLIKAGAFVPETSVY